MISGNFMRSAMLLDRGMEFLAANSELTPNVMEDLFQKIDAVLRSSTQTWASVQQK